MRPYPDLSSKPLAGLVLVSEIIKPDEGFGYIQRWR